MGYEITRRRFGATAASAAAVLASAGRARGDEPLRLRCSLDTAPTHVRNQSMVDYLGKLEAASGGRIKGEVFHSGQLFADLDVAKALIQGQVEMAVPGSWTITGIIPDADLFQLPVLYGQPVEIVHKIIDGKAGAIVADEISQKLRAHVIGPWLDLGFQTWYSTSKPLNTLDDLKGLKVRNSGGAGQAWRARFVGAIPNTTAWPNVPLALSQGMFDGLVSTNESINLAQLWEAGVKYAYEDHHFAAEYVPLVSNTFWEKLGPDLRMMMTDLWAENVAAYRANMAASQARARGILLDHGIKFGVPTAEQIAETRHRMMAEQDQLAQEIKISPALVKLVTDEVGSSA
jgi:TRAP-type C4-dicarboxylate transport system substrate-binding protein